MLTLHTVKKYFSTETKQTSPISIDRNINSAASQASFTDGQTVSAGVFPARKRYFERLRLAQPIRQDGDLRLL